MSTLTPMALAAPEPMARQMERSLVVRAQAGDGKAFRSIFDQHAPPVRRFLRDLLRNAEAADEATQETFVRAHRCLPMLRESDKLLPWLLGIARNVFHEQLRARPALGVPNSAISRLVSPGLIDGGEEPVDHSPSPEGLLIGREADALLAGALGELPEERRAALILRIDHGLEYEEIRMVLGWSIAKVKNEIHRARIELRARLAKYLGGKA